MVIARAGAAGDDETEALADGARTPAMTATVAIELLRLILNMGFRFPGWVLVGGYDPQPAGKVGRL
jgi:hypothetical protein